MRRRLCGGDAVHIRSIKQQTCMLSGFSIEIETYDPWQDSFDPPAHAAQGPAPALAIATGGITGEPAGPHRQ
jgi:hypothetical protein